nr:PHP domain-containing protein [Desulfobacterales bacterium]
AAGIPSGLHFISAAEISTAAPEHFPCHGSLHLLGYGVNPDDDQLRQALNRLQSARKNRNPRIIAKLNRLGIAITLDELEAGAADTQIGRPHIAAWLVKKGVVRTFEEAFEHYLGIGRPAYADKHRIACEEAIRLISNGGGVPVLAHPALVAPQGVWSLKELICELKECGLKGIEAFYPEHTAKQTATYLAWADQYDLVATGGTDFHGAIKPGIEMGIAGGDFHVPYQSYIHLTALIEQARTTPDAHAGKPGSGE